MSANVTTQAPSAPPNGPSDWTPVVRGNCFSNIQRLAIWTGGTIAIASGVDPSKYFFELGQYELGATVNGALPTIYVLVHGWAPGYLTAVNAQSGNLLWWGSKAGVGGFWASDWAWASVGPESTNPSFTVNPTGMLQQIIQQDPTAIALAYSWIDDSGTDDDPLDAYQSEAYTHVNGLRLANALQEAILPSFFQNGGQVHLIGHSHGSKVCTVAALTMQQNGIPAAHLTILDSPESYGTLTGNGANLNGCYLEQMSIQDPSNGGLGTFVDNYVSYFGVAYSPSGPTSPISNVVQVSLDPSALYNSTPDGIGDMHTYAAGWYGGAATGAQEQNQTPVGLAWPPIPSAYQPPLNQNWPGGAAQTSQWLLSGGPWAGTSAAYSASPISVTYYSSSGNATGNPSGTLTLTPAAPGWTQYSTWVGTCSWDNTNQFGFAFDLEWTSPQTGDYLVIAAGGLSAYTLLVIDGQSAPIGTTTVVFNSTVDVGWNETVSFYFLGSSNHSSDVVTISNFQWVAVDLSGTSVANLQEATPGSRT